MDRTTLGSGTVLWIPSEIGMGIFPTEHQVKIEVANNGRETIAGFVPKEDVKAEAGHQGLVRVVVLESTADKVAVLFRGEMLSGSNPFWVPRAWLRRVGRPE